MLVTNFHVKSGLYTIITALYQLFDVGRIHPVREREFRALKSNVLSITSKPRCRMRWVSRAKRSSLASRAYGNRRRAFVGARCFPGRHGPIHGGKRIGAKRTTAWFLDSFEGLPEKWGGFDLGKGALTMHGKLPRVPDNVVLHKGWFSDTLPVWSKANPGLIAFMHIDCDIYSSTVDILRDLAGQIGPGTVVLFDEYFNYPNWQNHEHRAWKEFAESRGITYTYLGFARQQVVIRVDAVNAPSCCPFYFCSASLWIRSRSRRRPRRSSQGATASTHSYSRQVTKIDARHRHHRRRHGWPDVPHRQLRR